MYNIPFNKRNIPLYINIYIGVTMATKYNGVSTKIGENGQRAILVRFQHLGTRYPVKNFTTIFGVKTEKQAYDKLQEIKVLISQGQDPFSSSSNTLDEVWDKWVVKKSSAKEWSDITTSNSKYFYNAYIKKSIGHKRINKITYIDLMDIIDSMQKENGTKNTLKRLLKPLFDDQIKKGNLQENVINKISTLKEPPSKQPLSKRTSEKPLDILRKLYKAIPEYNKTYKSIAIKAIMHMCLFTAHRTGELRKIKRRDINLNTMRVISPSSITKTKVDYHYPLPPELKSYVEALENEDIVFPISRGSMSAIFDRWLDIAKIELFDGKRLSWHDFRRMMVTVMVTDCKIDSMLADACLEHSPEGVKKHYFHFTYEDKCNAYQQYWDKIKEGI